MTSRPTRDAADELVRVAPRIGRYLRRVIEAETGSQSIIRYGVLKTLAQQACGNAELAAAMSVANPTMTGLIDQLVRAGLVRRDPDPDDRRAVRLSITQEGRAQLAATQAVLVDAMTGVMDDLGADELAGLILGLRALDSALANATQKQRNEVQKPTRDKAGNQS
jgi:DNA-binding MarR family transcriptional regulator